MSETSDSTQETQGLGAGEGSDGTAGRRPDLARIAEVMWKARFPAEQPRFNAWRRSAQIDKKTGHLKAREVPVNVRLRRDAGTNQPLDWARLDVVQEAAAEIERDNVAGGRLDVPGDRCETPKLELAGCAMLFHGDYAPDAGGRVHVAVVLDACVLPSGDLAPWAVPIFSLAFERLVYTELSPGGTGLRFVFKAKAPEGIGKVGARLPFAAAANGRPAAAALFAREGFVTVTGNVWPRSDDGVPRVGDASAVADGLAELVLELIERNTAGGQDPGPDAGLISLPTVEQARVAGAPVHEKRWIVAELVPIPGKPGRFSKVPKQELGQELATCGTNNPKAWLYMRDALAAAERWRAKGRNVGVGFVVGPAVEEAGRSPWRVVDCDRALDEEGQPLPWALKVWSAAAFIVRSASRTGFHAYTPGSTGHTTNVKQAVPEAPKINGKDAEFQLFGASTGFLMCTGDIEVVRGAEGDLLDLINEMWPVAEGEAGSKKKGSKANGKAGDGIDDGADIFGEPTGEPDAILSYLETANPDLHRLVNLTGTEPEAGSGGDRSRHLYKVTLRLLRAGVRPADILTLVRAEAPFADKVTSDRSEKWFIRYELTKALKEHVDSLGGLCEPSWRDFSARRTTGTAGGGKASGEAPGATGGPSSNKARDGTSTGEGQGAGDPEVDPAEKVRRERERLEELAAKYDSRVDGGEKVGRVEPIPYAIEGLLPHGEMILLAGPPKTGKSVLALTLHMHIAAGVPFDGREIRPGAKVLYVALESGTYLRQHYLGFLQRYGLNAADVPFFIQDRALDFATKEGLEGLQAWIKVRGITHVVIDTLIHVAGQRNAAENVPSEMQGVMKILDNIRGSGVSMMVLHHTKKGEDGVVRGASSLVAYAAYTFVMRPERRRKKATVADLDRTRADPADDDDDSEPVTDRPIKVTNPYYRGAQSPPLKFVLKQIELGKDEKGRPVTCVIAETTTDGQRQENIDAELEKWLRTPKAQRSSERALLDRLEPLGLPRSTAQRRLKRLREKLGIDT